MQRLSDSAGPAPASRSFLGLSLALLLILLLAPSPAVLAQDAPAEDEPSAEAAPEATEEPLFTAEDVLYVRGILPKASTTSSIATRLPLARHRIPASVSVITGPVLEEQGAVILGDALRNAAGVNVHTNSGVTDYFLIRGFDSLSSGLVLTDGVSEPEATFYHLYNVDRLEVLRGPGAFLYGGNTLSGVASLVRKQPQATDFLETAVTGGSFGTYRGQLDYNSASEDGDFAFRFNGMWGDSDGYRDGIESSALAINPSFHWQLGTESDITLNLEYVDNQYTPDAGLPVIDQTLLDVPRERSYGSPFDDSDQELYRLRLDYRRQLTERLTLRNRSYYTSLDWQSDGTLLAGAFPLPPQLGGSLVAFRSFTSLDDRQEFYGNQLELLWEADTGGVRHNLVMGVEVERRTDEFRLDVGSLPLIDVFAPVETVQGRPAPIPGLGQRGDATSDIVAPYIIDRMEISESFQLLAGVRFDTIDYEEGVSRTSRSDSEVSPMLGLVYTPTPRVTLYANAAQAFSPPSTLVTGEREPEESRQIEVGVKRQFLDGRLEATLAVYDLDKRNIAIPDQTGITRNQGDQSSQGAELELAAVLAPGLRGFLSYAYNDAELTEFRELQLGFLGATIIDYSGNRPAFTPDHIANLWLSKRFGGGLRLAGGLRWVSDQFIDEDNRFTIDQYVTVDAAVSYPLGNFEWRLNLRNITDEEYVTRAFGNTSVLPAEPFAVYGGVTFRR